MHSVNAMTADDRARAIVEKHWYRLQGRRADAKEHLIAAIAAALPALERPRKIQGGYQGQSLSGPPANPPSGGSGMRPANAPTALEDHEGGIAMAAEQHGRIAERKALSALDRRAPPSTEREWAMLAGLRLIGWRVAIHNDYRASGIDHSFWLLTHPNGRWIKGEGLTDLEALSQAAEQAALVADKRAET